MTATTLTDDRLAQLDGGFGPSTQEMRSLVSEVRRLRAAVRYWAKLRAERKAADADLGAPASRSGDPGADRGKDGRCLRCGLGMNNGGADTEGDSAEVHVCAAPPPASGDAPTPNPSKEE